MHCNKLKLVISKFLKFKKRKSIKIHSKIHLKDQMRTAEIGLKKIT